MLKLEGQFVKLFNTKRLDLFRFQTYKPFKM